MNNMAVYQHKQFATPNEEHNIEQLPLQKRKRDDNELSQMDNARMANAQPSTKRRQAKSLFRPWCDTQETPKATTAVKIAKTSPIANVPTVSQPPQMPRPSAPNMISPYQLALQQQQQHHQTALVMQQAVMYQRQMMLAHLWARQQQQQQHQLQMQHHYRQQQLFAFGSQQ